MTKFKRGDVVRRKDGSYFADGKLITRIHHVEERLFGSFWAWFGEGMFMPFEYIEHATPHPNPPHKHAELIKAWADGAVIEVKKVVADGWLILKHPQWEPEATYRIKPHNTKPDNEKEIEHLRSEILRMSKELEELAGK